MKQGMSPSGNEHMIDIKDFGSVKSCGFIQKYKWGGDIWDSFIICWVSVKTSNLCKKSLMVNCWIKNSLCTLKSYLISSYPLFLFITFSFTGPLNPSVKWFLWDLDLTISHIYGLHTLKNVIFFDRFWIQYIWARLTKVCVWHRVNRILWKCLSSSVVTINLEKTRTNITETR